MAKEEVGHALFRLNSTLRRFIETNPQKQTQEPIPHVGMWLIHYLADNRGTPVYMRDVERRLGMTRSSASKLVDQLDRLGLVERRTEERDMRLRRLELTPAAENLLQTICEEHQLVESTLTGGFTAAEVSGMLRDLERMRENLDAALLARQNPTTERSESSLD